MTESGTADTARPRAEARYVIAPSATVEVALVDRSGTIVAVNDAWTAFGAANGGDPDRSGVGCSYLAVCDGADDRHAREVARALHNALAGDLPAPARVALPCHAPGTPRWFDVLISSRYDDLGACVGGTVTLSAVRSALVPEASTADLPYGPALPAFYLDRSERLGDVFAQVLLERAPVGILVVDDQGIVVRAGRAAEHLFGHAAEGLCGAPIGQVLPGLDLLDPRPGPEAPVVGTAEATVTADGVRSDGTIMAVEVRVGPVPLSRGTGAVVLVREATAGSQDHHPDHVTYLDHEVAELVDGLDVVVRHIFTSGLTVTGAAAARQTDRALVTSLIGVTGNLDQAIQELRAVAFRLQQWGRRAPSRRPGSDTG
jgi:PAS domain S-box-containing protein